MKNKPINILYLEDFKMDFQLIHEILIRSGIDLIIDNAINKQEFILALKKKKYDIILSDFNLLGYNAFDALEKTKELYLDIPFIVVSGTIGEEKAVELIKNGAIDCVMKDKLERLPLVIKRVIKEVEQKKINEKVKKIMSEFDDLNKTLLQTIPFGIDIVDEEGNILFLNDYFHKTFDIKSIGKKCWELYRDDKKQCSDCPLFKGIKLNETKNYETNGVLGGRTFSISHTGMMFRGKKAMLEIFQDITERKKIETKLLISKERAEESDRLKTEFLASMSHEIRTPMNSILGFSSLINKDTLPNKLIDYINIIRNSGELLLAIIDDILDLSKLQSGVFKIEKEYFDIKSMILKSEEEYNHCIKIRNKNIDLVLEIGENVCGTYSDINRIKQVLNSLINNAIKFTDNGNITYGYNKTDNNIIFYVKDTGIGISEKNISEIFERFFRVRDIGQKKYEGTGLGLTISKAIVELLGGKIWVDSELGKGTTFYFTIPIDMTELKTLKMKVMKKKYDWSKKKVLIIEDNIPNYKLLEILLTQSEIKIIHASNGLEFYKLINKNKYDIVLLDIQLPDISGYEILEYIKKNTKIPVIIQSAFGSKEDIEKAKLLGVDYFMVKPIIWNTLSREMDRLINLKNYPSKNS